MLSPSCEGGIGNSLIQVRQTSERGNGEASGEVRGEIGANSDPAPSCATCTLATLHTRENTLEVAVTETACFQGCDRRRFFRLSGGRTERSHLPPAGFAHRAEEISAAPLPLQVFYGARSRAATRITPARQCVALPKVGGGGRWGAGLESKIICFLKQ